MATKKRSSRSPVKQAVHRAKRIAMFNHKGGVSKTTTTFNLGWMLASKGHKVVLVDADPQCNLSGLVPIDAIESISNAICDVVTTS